MFEGIADKIAGVIHGVMPAIGAAAAYRRTKVGMHDESYVTGWVLGGLGSDVTPVFAQSPGALELLPNKQYPMGWLRISDEKGRLVDAYPKADPYEEIYLNRKDWWGLIKEEWLMPTGGIKWSWDDYMKYGLTPAKKFHDALGTSYHPNTYVYCGEPLSPVEHNSAAKLTWQISRPPYQPIQVPPASIPGLGTANVEQPGNNFLAVRSRQPGDLSTDNSAQNAVSWRLIASLFDAGGDGTVPAVSGRAPATQNPGCVQQQVRLAGVEHEGAYRDNGAQDFVFYAVAKIATKARKPSK
jgi:hypothetical protein